MRQRCARKQIYAVKQENILSCINDKSTRYLLLIKFHRSKCGINKVSFDPLKANFNHINSAKLNVLTALYRVNCGVSITTKWGCLSVICTKIQPFILGSLLALHRGNVTKYLQQTAYTQSIVSNIKTSLSQTFCTITICKV